MLEVGHARQGALSLANEKAARVGGLAIELSTPGWATLHRHLLLLVSHTLATVLGRSEDGTFKSPPRVPTNIQRGPKMVPGEGFEPPTFGLQNRCTTTVLTRHFQAF
jgi:hypothetical protein